MYQMHLQKNTIKLNTKWRKDYKKQGYKFLSRENIFKNVIKIIKTPFLSR